MSTHAWLDTEGKPGNETLVTFTFTERGGKTELTLHQTGFESIESRDGQKEGWTSTFDRLAEYLAEEHARQLLTTEVISTLSHRRTRGSPG